MFHGRRYHSLSYQLLDSATLKIQIHVSDRSSVWPLAKFNGLKLSNKCGEVRRSHDKYAEPFAYLLVVQTTLSGFTAGNSEVIRLEIRRVGFGACGSKIKDKISRRPPQIYRCSIR